MCNKLGHFEMIKLNDDFKVREASNKKNSKQSDIYQKGGVGSEKRVNKI